MRLVDADNARECFGGDGVTGAVMKRMFDSLPTIDAVPVVRCRECKYYKPISIHAPREGCDSKLYQRAESLLGSICLFAQGEEG